MRYLPHTPDEIKQMLEVIGTSSVEQLFEQSVPAEARYQGLLPVEPALDETSLMRHLEELAAKNQGSTMLSFLGAGAYDHHIPPAVDQLLLRGEFYTAYTPYQAEVSQGTLQAIFEFQTIVSEILGLPIANASMYDGASAAAEAVLMARRLTKRDRIIVSESVHPEYIEVIRTYLQWTEGGKAAVEVVPLKEDGVDDVEAIQRQLGEGCAAVLLGYPSFLGTIGDVRKIGEIAHENGAKLITATSEPYALAILESPGSLGADIAVGEGQPLATPSQFGGPGVGLLACQDGRTFLQQIPGRLCGQTVDKDGTVGYVLTLVTREQFIRRERATSNICTNQGLIALAMTIRVSLLGKRGFVETAKHCLAKTEYAKTELSKIPGFSLVYPNALTFNEFVLRVPGGDAAAVVEALLDEKILVGLALGRVDSKRADQLLVSFTERHRREDIDLLASALTRFATKKSARIFK
jgi:glycine dehydrogenase subunit 1